MRYDRVLNRHTGFGLYTSLTHGTFLGGDIAGTKHTKFSLGMTKKIYHCNFASIGLSYHNYQKAAIYQDLNWRVLFPVDLELGMGTIINWVSVSVVYNVVTNTSGINIGVKF
jgi:hypothetical protein